ncbi:hypothetical protein [Arthrobacter sp. 92]|uniref:hypothetical protein n=1 Tax=Arthrobacter sp. 92 TaxID=3418175 RepID=UPI003CFC4E7C
MGVDSDDELEFFSDDGHNAFSFLNRDALPGRINNILAELRPISRGMVKILPGPPAR